MAVDGAKLRKVREENGYSQEKLAALCNVNKRTIQRAEANEPIAPETLAFIAEALEMRPVDLRLNLVQVLEGSPVPERERDDEVILLPCNSGRRLVETLVSSDEAAFDYDVEPRRNNVDLLKAVAELFGKIWVDRWTPIHECPDLSDADLLGLKAELNELLAEMAGLGVTIYMGTYPIAGPEIFYGEFGEKYARTNRPDIRLTKCLLVISDEQAPYLSRMPNDHINHIPF